MIPAPLSDAELDLVLGDLRGIRAPTLEEAADLQAAWLRECAIRGVDEWRVTLTPSQVYHTARLLDTLVLLSREGAEAP